MKSKKLISLILSAAMVVPLLPVWAEGELSGQFKGEIQDSTTEEQAMTLLEELMPQQAAVEEPIDMELAAEDAKQAVAVSSGEALVPADDGYWHESMEQYQDYDYSDPNWVTDKEFFGEWNGSEWTQQPKIDYSYGNHELLLGAEAAVKDGDYELAKEFVFEYYKNKFQNQPRVYSPTANRRTNLQAQLVFDNMFFNQLTGYMVEDIVSVPNTEAEVSANILEIVQGKTSAVSKEQCFVITALKKDGYQVDFNSMDAAEHTPYVIANVNGTNRIFYPTQDAMISAGGNANRNYQYQKTISVQEAAIGESQPVNSDTKRIYINIDFTGLVAGDEVTEARLYLYGHNTKPEGNKDVVVFSNNASIWDEETVTWDSLEHLIFSYDGESGPKWEQPEGAGYRFHEEMNRFEQYADALCSRYAYAHEEVFAYHGLRTWLDFYKKRGYNPGYFKNLDLGVRGEKLPRALAYYIDSEFMTKDVFTPLLKFAWAMGDALVTNWNNQSLTSNWGSYETNGLTNLAVNFNEFYDATKPLEEGATPENGGRGGWVDVSGYRYVALCGEMMFVDGSCTECSVEYAAEAVSRAIAQVSVAREAGWQDFEMSEDLQELLLGLARYIVNATGPGGVDFQQGNAASYNHSHLQTVRTVANAIDDPFLQWAVSNGTAGTAPDYTSILYPVGVKAILRSGWQTDDVYIQTNADGGIATHGHHDDMALNMFAYGQYLLVDPKYMNYDKDNPYRAWLNSNRGHNTVEINDVSARANTWNFSTSVVGPSGETLRFPKQNTGVQGSIVDSELNSGYDYVYLNSPNYINLEIDGNLYANVDYDRSILFIHPGYVIVTDYLKAQDDKVNKYSQGWHFLPDANPTIDETTGVVQTNFASGADIQVIPVQQNDTMEKNLLDGWYSYGTGNVERAQYATYVKNQAGNTTFNTLLLPTKDGQKLEGSTENITLDVAESVANAFHLTISEEATNTETEGTYYTLLDKEQQTQREVDDHSTDGTLMYVEQENGYYTRMILRGGTNIVESGDGPKLLRSKSNLEDINVKYSGTKVELNSSKTVNLEELQLYSGGKKIADVTWNGESVGYKQDGATGDIYFAETMPFAANTYEEPTGTPTPTPTPTPTNTPRVTPGSGSSGNRSSGGGSGALKGNGDLVNVIDAATPTPNATQEPNHTPAPTQYQQELNGHWAETEISEMLEEGIVQGTGAGELGLQEQTTRAEFVTMLVRALNMEIQQFENDFADVSTGDWYADYMATAKKEGILDGDGVGANPNGLITREEMAKILVETYEKEHGEIVVSSEHEIKMQDSDAISDWAKPYIQKAVAAGLMKGVSNDMFAPQENALREQAIVVIYRIKKK